MKSGRVVAKARRIQDDYRRKHGKPMQLWAVRPLPNNPDGIPTEDGGAVIALQREAADELMQPSPNSVGIR